MVSFLALSVAKRGFEPRSGSTNDNNWYLLLLHLLHSIDGTVLLEMRINSNNMSEWSHTSTNRLLFQWASPIKIHLKVLIWYSTRQISSLSNVPERGFSPWCSWHYCSFVIKQRSLTETVLLCNINVVYLQYGQFVSNWVLGRVMVFNTTFNNIPVISWRSVFLVEERRLPEENHWPVQVTDKLYHIKNVV